MEIKIHIVRVDGVEACNDSGGPANRENRGLLQIGLVNMNKLVIKITTHCHRGGMNTDILVINNTK